MRPAHPETEETTHTLAAMPSEIAIAVQAAPDAYAAPTRPVSLAEVWEALELWWLAFLARLIARGEDVPLCPCCEAKMCGLGDESVKGGSHPGRSPMGMYLAAAPQLSARARRHLARGIAERLRAMRACGESWRVWVCDRLQKTRARAAGTTASNPVSVPLRVGAGRGPPEQVHIIDKELFRSPPALGRRRFGLRGSRRIPTKVSHALTLHHLPLIPAQAGIQSGGIEARSRAEQKAACLGPRLRGGERKEKGERWGASRE